MTTIVNNPPSSDNSGGPLTAIIVLVVLVVLGFFAYKYGLPALRGITSGPATINVNVNQQEPQ